MPQAWVHNYDDKEYSEKFRDDIIRIPANGKVEMEWSEANMFVAAYIPIKKLPNGEFVNCKKLRVEKIPGKAEPQLMTPKCHLCKEDFQTEKELILHSELKHKDQMLKEKKPAAA